MRILIFVILVCIIWMPIWVYLLVHSVKVFRESKRYTQKYERSLGMLEFSIKMICCGVLFIVLGGVMLWS